jgi:hypothetical protein
MACVYLIFGFFDWVRLPWLGICAILLLMPGRAPSSYLGDGDRSFSTRAGFSPERMVIAACRPVEGQILN